ncbi:MAG: na+/Pi-cotransporter family protein [Micavibrio sp.]|nr:na+/Pi-cotransporter family protein [Micavibrio sp.]
MSVTLILLTILSGICLLLWGLRTVKRAFLRGYGAQLQKTIAKGTKNRFLAFLSGLGVTMLLQSSTATALLTASFVGRGLMAASMGIAVMLGADIGTALVTQLLSFKMSWLAPLMISTGVILHLSYDEGSRTRYPARIILGLGFMLTALNIIHEASAHLADSETLQLILSPLLQEPILAILTASLLAYIFHSSLSAILLFAGLAMNGVLPLELALIFVIGANLGGALIAFVAMSKDTAQARLIPLANILMRVVIASLSMFFIQDILRLITEIDTSVIQKVILAHIGFNASAVILFLPFVGFVEKLCTRLHPVTAPASEKRIMPRHLDRKALSTPSIALSCATRETLHMAEILETMLKDSFEAISTGTEAFIQQVKEEDDILDRIYGETKNYIIHLTREELDDKEATRSMHIMTFATNLEHCGDIVDKSLMELARKKIQNRDQFSEEGLAEIKAFYERILESLQLAQSIFLSGDDDLAQQLLDGKKSLKKAEAATAQKHFERLRKGLPQTIATSELHMDVIRDYRRINTYISAIAYSILDKAENAQS